MTTTCQRIFFGNRPSDRKYLRRSRWSSRVARALVDGRDLLGPIIGPEIDIAHGGRRRVVTITSVGASIWSSPTGKKPGEKSLRDFSARPARAGIATGGSRVPIFWINPSSRRL
jgi:hypothetical protein